MNEVLKYIQNDGIVVNLNIQDKDKYPYVKNCFEDISNLMGKYYVGKSKAHWFYYCCRVNKRRIYIFVDSKNKFIKVYDEKEIGQVSSEIYDEIYSKLKSSKSAEKYIIKIDKTKKIRQIMWLALIVVNFYVSFKNIVSQNSLLDATFLYTALILSLQDCNNEFLIRFESKINNLMTRFLCAFEIAMIVIICAINLMNINFNSTSIFYLITFLSTIGTLILKFSTVKNRNSF